MTRFAKHIIIFLLTLFCVAAALAQQTEFQITRYDETTGLESNVINAMLQDSRGYLWFGTADGLCRYDGYNFKTFRKIAGENNSLPGNFVSKLAEDKDGKIWIGLLKDGISCYDPSTGIFRNYDVRNVDPSTPLARQVTMLVVDNENNIWAGIAQKGLVKLNKTTSQFSRYNIISDTNTFYSKEFRAAYNNVYAMYEEGKNIYWLATHDGLYRFDAGTAQMLPVRAKPLLKNSPYYKVNGTIRDDLFTNILPDKDGVWMGSWAGGLSHYNFRKKQWLNYKFNEKKNVATTNIVSDIKPKSEHEIWISSVDKGLGIFDKITKRFTFFGDSSKNTGIPFVVGTWMLTDKQNNIWLSSLDGLLKIKQTEKKFIHIPVTVSRSDNGPYYGINCMLEDKSGKYLLIGTSFADGLHIKNKQTGEMRSISFAVNPNEESALVVNNMMEDSHGVMWLLTRDFVYQYNLQKNKLIFLPQPESYLNGSRSNWYTILSEDKNGKIWIATLRNGVFCYNQLTKKYAHFYNDPANKNSLPSNVITALAIDCRQRVWVGGTRGCFGYFENGSGNFINLDQYGQQSAYNSDNRVYTLYTDKKGDILAGTDGGLYYYNAHKTLPELRNIYNAESGLRGDVAGSIQEDGKGDIWCVTGSALCKINRQTGNITPFRKQDGIDKVHLLNRLFLFQNGQMAASAVQGYYLFNPLLFPQKDTAVPAVITSFKVDDKEQYFENSIAANKAMEVAADANVISFEFAALDFDRPDKQQYSYILQGFDKGWVMAGTRRYAGYANIPGGDYVFKVKATNSPENWNVAVASIQIHVATPFYKTWWFILSILVEITILLYTFFRFKLEKQQQILQLETKAQILQKEKALVMYESLKQQLNPHFLFNSLTSLGSLIRYDQNKAASFLEGLSKIYRYILKSRHNETVMIAEEIKFVETFIGLQQTRFDHGLIININIDKEFDQCKIVPVTLQNMIENAIKHNIIDHDSPLIVDIFTQENYIVVRNNLQKKNFVETSNKQGLFNLTSLYEYLSDKPVLVKENDQYFSVHIPMI